MEGVMKKKANKKTVSRFVVSFTVEVEHDGEAADVCPEVEGAVADMVDFAYDHHGRRFESHGIKITDTVNFGAQVE
jgi:methyl coenzyme M reductase subunit D